jgi:Mce-associated membrane protein
VTDDVRGLDGTKDLTKDAETEIIGTAGEEPQDDAEDLDDAHDLHDAEHLDDADEADIDDETDIVAIAAEDADSAEAKGSWRRDIWHRQISVKPIPVILILLLLISGGVTAWLYFQYRQPDQRTSPSVARAAINAASDGTIALLSYSPDSLDKDFATAKSHLSGDFLSYYDQFTQQIVAPAAKAKSLKTSARVMRAAVQELRPDSAVVLVFVDQSTTSKDTPEPSMSASSVVVNLALVDGQWLITKFTPV